MSIGSAKTGELSAALLGSRAVEAAVGCGGGEGEGGGGGGGEGGGGEGEGGGRGCGSGGKGGSGGRRSTEVKARGERRPMTVCRGGWACSR